MIIGIDTGNSQMKTVNHTFPSAVKENKMKNNLSTETIQYNGLYYDLTTSRIKYQMDKTNDDRYFILTLFAIAKELESRKCYAPHMSVTLAVGLPPEHYPVNHSKYKRYFLTHANTKGVNEKKPVEFRYNDTKYIVNIDSVKVYAQAFAAVMPQAEILEEYPRVFIVDIGGYTVDVLLMNKFSPDMTYCKSLNRGIITMTNEIQSYIRNNYMLNVPEVITLAALRGEKIPLNNSNPEAIEVIFEMARQHAQNILDELKELDIDLGVDAAFFCGGGSMLLEKQLRSTGMAAPRFANDIAANARGYELLAQKALAVKR